MELVIVSDNHGREKVLKDLLKKHGNASAFIHCGDIELAPEKVQSFHAVRGNNDPDLFPEFQVVTVKDYRIFVIHSHQLSFFNRLEELAALAQEHQCQIACFGHTHRFEQRMVDGVLCINPGSLFYNRDGSQPSYALLRLKSEGLVVERRWVKDLY